MAKQETPEHLPYKQIKTENLTENNYLHSLTRLFESNSKSCTAACLINDVIVLADNNIHGGTSNSTKVDLINKTMKYFAQIKNVQEQNQVTNELNEKNRVKILTNLCKQRITGEELGYIKLEDKVIKEIIHDVCFKEDWAKKWHTKNGKKSEYNPAQRPNIASALELASSIRDDFIRIEALLTQQEINPDLTDLISAFRGEERQQVLMHSSGAILTEWKNKGYVQNPYQENRPGYVIVKFDRKEVHAETRLLEYLMITGVIDNIEKDQGIYIAISKLCCAGCDHFLKTVAKTYEIKIDYKGTHGRQPDWEQPIILYNEHERVTHSYIITDKNNETSLGYVAEGTDLPEKTELYPYCYIDDKITQHLKVQCPSLKADSKVGEMHLAAHSGDELTSPTSSPANMSDKSDDEDRMNILINELLVMSNKNALNEKQCELLNMIISKSNNSKEPLAPLQTKQIADLLPEENIQLEQQSIASKIPMPSKAKGQQQGTSELKKRSALAPISPTTSSPPEKKVKSENQIISTEDAISQAVEMRDVINASGDPAKPKNSSKSLLTKAPISKEKDSHKR
jgi:hypothetical protein